ncbi:MAG: PDZ domain-containing protein [Chloroflexi bacterium]|nr:PDZ domain-containing protein [Chloroflexota bacterium]MBI3763114.1 PDZ domain-containing protein [Chloroflexota bacterium]
MPTTSSAERQLRVLDALWSAIDDQYVYKDFNGVDWKAAHDETRAKIESGLTDDEFVKAVRAMTGKLPAGTVQWQTREERIAGQTSNTQTYEGIGAFVSVRGAPKPHVILLSVMKDSPAAKAGLSAHDSIYAIDGVAVKAEEGLDVIQRVRGPAGTMVKLTVQSPGGSSRDVDVKRGQLTAGAELLGGTVTGTHIAYFLIPTQPPDKMADNLVAALQSMKQAGTIAGIILDLRIARTGAQWPLAEFLTLFGNGKLGNTYTREGEQPLDITGKDFFGSQAVPLVLLVGPDTEGAPEMLAGALQDISRAKVVGLPTLGEVEGTSETALPDGSRVFVASSSFVTAKGRDLGLKGVEPDEVVKSDWDEVSDTNDPVLDKAVEVVRKIGS